MKSGCRVIAVLVGVSVLIISQVYCDASQTIVLSGSYDTKNSIHGRWLALIYTEVFHRLGYGFEYHGYPSALSSRMSDEGRVDGEINRVSVYQKAHPNVIRVDEPHFLTTLAAYAVKPGISVDGWESLKNTNFRVEYRQGTRIVEIGLTPVVKAKNLTTITKTEQGLKRLISGRIDLFIDVKAIVQENLDRLDPVRFDPSPVYLAGIMVQDTLHLYLHKKKADLVPKVNRILRTMKQQGLIEHYRQIAINKIR